MITRREREGKEAMERRNKDDKKVRKNEGK